MPYRRTGRPPGRPRHPGLLTPAELRVLELVRAGLTTREIGRRLGISQETVHTHVSHLLSKLDLHQRSELADWQPPAEATPVAHRSWWSVAPLGFFRPTRTSIAAVLA